MHFDLNVEVVGLITTVVLVIFAFAKLQFNDNQNSKEIGKLWDKHESLEKEIKKDLSTFGQTLSRIEGFLFQKGKD